MARLKSVARLEHYILERNYFGSHAGGWQTTKTSIALSRPYVLELCTPGKEIPIVCEAESCGQEFTFRVLTLEERKHLFKQRIKRFLTQFLVGYILTTLGGLLNAFLGDNYAFLGVVGIFVAVIGTLITLNLLIKIIFERTPLIHLTPSEPFHFLARGSQVGHGIKLF